MTKICVSLTEETTAGVVERMQELAVIADLFEVRADLALGPLGILTRIAAGRWGAPFTFASAGRGAETAPGQIPAAEMADLYRARDINPLTKLYGVLGTDVVWSLSPVLHNRAFEARGLDAGYVPLQAEYLEGFLAALPAFALSGFRVSRPFLVDIVR